MVEQFGLVLRVQTIGTLGKALCTYFWASRLNFISTGATITVKLHQPCILWKFFKDSGGSCVWVQSFGIINCFLLLLHSDILISMWEKLCGVLLAKHHFYILTWKSNVDLLFPTDGFPVDLWPRANHLLILSSALNGTLNVYF